MAFEEVDQDRIEVVGSFEQEPVAAAEFVVLPGAAVTDAGEFIVSNR